MKSPFICRNQGIKNVFSKEIRFCPNLKLCKPYDEINMQEVFEKKKEENL